MFLAIVLCSSGVRAQHEEIVGPLLDERLLSPNSWQFPVLLAPENSPPIAASETLVADKELPIDVRRTAPGTLVGETKPAVEQESTRPETDLDKTELAPNQDPREPHVPWSRAFEFGVAGAQGPSESFDMRLGLEAQRTTPHVSHSFELRHADKRAREQTDVRTVLVEGRVEWPTPEDGWTYYVHGSSELEKVEKTDYRVAADTGVGYELTDEDDKKLVWRVGGSWSGELNEEDSELTPELSTGIEWNRKVSDRHRITARVEYFPSVQDVEEFRLNSKAAWEMLIDPDSGLSLKFNVSDRQIQNKTAEREIGRLDYSALFLWPF